MKIWLWWANLKECLKISLGRLGERGEFCGTVAEEATKVIEAGETWDPSAGGNMRGRAAIGLF